MIDPRPESDPASDPEFNAASDDEGVPPPATGVELIDNAMAALDLSGPVSEHPAQLASAVELLQQVLRNPPQQ